MEDNVSFPLDPPTTHSHGRRLGWQFPTKKLLRLRWNRRNNWFTPAEFQLFRGTENSRNSTLNRSAEEENARNSVPWDKIRSKHSEFRSEPYRERENNSEFRSVEQKYKQTLRILFQTIPRKRQQCGIPLGGKHAVNSVCRSMIFCKTNFFHAISFLSELRKRTFCKLPNASVWAISSAE